MESDDPLERLALALAPLVAESAGEPASLLDASQVARRLGVDRSWVYEHAEELGVIRLGAGPRPRLRFDPVLVSEAFREAIGTSRPRNRARGRRARRKTRTTTVELLPIGPQRGVRSARGRPGS